MEDVPRSFIKNVALQISEYYKLDNAPYSDDEKEQKIIPFIGRKRNVEKFLEFLNGNAKKGVFLVTGYKGMGKTSFVNYVIHQYKTCDHNGDERSKKSKNKIIPIHLTLTQNNPKEIDILRLLVSSVHEKYDNYRRRNIIATLLNVSAKTWLYCFRLIFFLCIFFTVFFTLIQLKKVFRIPQGNGLTIVDGIKTVIEQVPLDWLKALVGVYIALMAVKLFGLREDKNRGPFNRIKQLVDRSYSALSEENTNEDDFSIASIKAKFGASERRVKRYPMANTKEIEFELQQFLKKISEKNSWLKRKPLEFIFIFDELDKIDTIASSSYLYGGLEINENKQHEALYEREMRERKQAIVNIIASLKNFFTTAPARFVFIAGREMFDASLADIADRQSSVSSIFTYIFNVESLLKETELESGSNRSSLSNAIELYLRELFFAEHPKKMKRRSSRRPSKTEMPKAALYKLAEEKYLKHIIKKDDFEQKLGKLYFTLQNFVTFLTYRSNGSPQKLIKTIHEFILVKEDFNEENEKNLIYWQEYSKSHLYLHFNYENQYRIGFINYLYKPFVIRWGGKLKIYSDNIAVATPYLFDHLLKFHPFAFSLENLEMIPEVLSTNKTPFLRQHIRMIIDHLSSSHIRETEISLFEYKFYSRTINEIAYLSKIFETEAAAYNFTLDESHLVKLHITGKIRELRNIYHKFLGESDIDYHTFSISHLSEVLGDLHFFDQEYDDAITAYSDAIKALGRLNIGESMDVRNFVTLTKNKLKLGLCFEKTNSYEEALAAYTDCCNDAKKFMAGRLVKGVPFDIKNLHEYYKTAKEPQNATKEIVFYSSSLSNHLQMILQGYLAKIFMQEKIGIEGISNLKLSIAIGSFLKMFEGFLNAPGRNYLLKANAYTFIGKLWYFKNNQLEFDLKNTLDENIDLNQRKKILPQDFLDQMRNVIKNNQHFIKNQSGKNKPVSALSIYILSLYEVISAKYGSTGQGSIKGKEIELVKEIKKCKNSGRYKVTASLAKSVMTDAQTFLEQENSRFRAVHYRYIATLLSNIGDCLLSIYEPSDTKYNKFTIGQLFYNFKKSDSAQALKTGDFSFFLKKSGKTKIDLTDIMRCYYLSGQYFLKYGRKISCSFQYNKILHVLRIVLTTGSTGDKENTGVANSDAKSIADNPNTASVERPYPLVNSFLDMLEKTVINPLLQMAAETSGGIDTHVINKAKNYKVQPSFSLNNISFSQESREPVLLYHYIAIKIGSPPTNIEKLISPYNTISTQYSRMIELDFYAKYCESQINGDIVSNAPIRELIVNCLFTRFTMVRLFEIYGANYAIGHRYLAYTHYRIAYILKNHEGIIGDEKDYVNQRLNVLLGYKAQTSIKPVYHYQKAKDLYEKTLQMHSGGREYRKMMTDVIYLEDDFNDNACHFGAALDRYFIVNGAIEKWVDECDYAIKESGNYSADLYLMD